MEIELYAQHDRIICCNNACADRPLCTTTRFSPSPSSSSSPSLCFMFMYLLVFASARWNTWANRYAIYSTCERSKPESEMGFGLNGRRETRFLWWADWRLVITNQRSVLQLVFTLRHTERPEVVDADRSWLEPSMCSYHAICVNVCRHSTQSKNYLFFRETSSSDLRSSACGQIVVSIPTMLTTNERSKPISVIFSQ